MSVGYLLMLLLTGAAAQEPLVTDRPDFTESPTAIAPGRVQVEGGYTYTRKQDDDEHALGELLVRAGLAPGWELRLAPPSYVWQRGPSGDATGFNDAAVGFKVELLRAAAQPRWDRPDLALLGMLSVPSGHDALGEDAWQPEAVLAAGWDLTPRVGLGANLGAGYASEGGQQFWQGLTSVALGYGLTDRWSLFAEYFGLWPEARADGNSHYADGGATYLLGSDLQLDVRLGVGFNGDGQDLFAGLGAARRW